MAQIVRYVDGMSLTGRYGKPCAEGVIMGRSVGRA